MSGLYFKIGADFDKVVRLKKEIDDLKTKLSNMDKASDPKCFRSLESQLASTEKVFQQVTVRASVAATQLKQTGQDAESMSRSCGILGKSLLALGGVTVIEQLASKIVSTRSEFQQLEISFGTMLKSKGKADKLMSEIVDFAAKTPFDLQQVAQGAKQLLAYGSKAENVTDELRMMGDVASGVSVPIGDLIYLYGTLKAQDRATTIDIRQFAGRGIPIYEELSKVLGVTVKEVNTFVSDGKVGFAQVEQAFQNMTSQGGMFHNLMQEQAKSFGGQLSNIGDTLSQKLNDLGKEYEGLISSGIGVTAGFIEHLDDIVKTIGVIVAAYGAYRAALILCSAAQKAQIALGNIQAWFQLAKGIRTAKDAQVALNLAIKANPIGLLLGLLAAAATAFMMFRDKSNDAEKASKKLNDATNDLQASLYTEKAVTEALFNRLKNTTKGTQEYEKIKKAIIDRGGEYLANQSEEIRSLKDIEGAQIAVNAAIEDNIRLKARDAFISQAATDKGKQQSESLRNLYDELIRQKGQKVGDVLFEQVKSYLEDDTEYGKIVGYLRENGITEGIGYGKSITEGLVGYTNAIGAFREAEKDSKRFYEKSTPKADAPEPTKLPNISEQTAQIKKDIASAEKDLLSFRSKDSTKTTSDIEDAEKKVKELKSKLSTLTGITEKDGDKTLKSQQDLAQSIIDNELKLQSEKHALMQDGIDKDLALIEDEKNQKLAAIEKDRKERIAKNTEAGGSGVLSKQEEADFKVREDSTIQDADKKRFEKEYEYARKTEALYEELADVFLTEEERKAKAVQDKYDKLRHQVNEKYDNEIFNAKLTKPDKEAKNIEWESNQKRGEDRAAIDRAQKQEEYKIDLQEYEEFARNYLSKSKEFEDNLKSMKERGESEESIEGVKKIQDQLLAEMDNEMEVKNQSFTTFIDGMIGMGLEQLLAALAQAEAALIASKDGQGGKESTASLNAKIKALQGQIQTLTQNKQEKVTGDPTKKWKDTLGVMNDVKGLTSDIIGNFDGLDDTTKVVFESAMNIATGVINMIIGITTLAAGASAATTATAVTAASAIKGVENASVILAIISAALQIAMAIANAIKGLFNDDKKHEKKIQDMQKEVDALSKAYDKLGKAIDNAYSSDKAKLIDNESENLKKQNALMKQQIEEESAKKKTDQGKIEEWQNQIEKNQEQIEENSKKRKIEAIMGTEIKSAIDEFSQAYADAWAAGEDRAKSMKDVVRNMIKGAVVEMIKAKMSPEIGNLMAYLASAVDNGINSSEQAIIDGMTDKIYRAGEAASAGMEKFLKDKEDEEIKDGVSGQLQAAMTEGTANRVEGVINQVGIRMIDVLKTNKEYLEVSRLGFIDVKKIMEQSFLIERNTRQTAENTLATVRSLENGFEKLDTRLGSIEDSVKQSKDRW